MVARPALHAIVFTAAVLSANLAQARIALADASPANGSEVASADRVELRFSERLIPGASTAQLTMTAMPGMREHPPMGMAVTVSTGRDGKTLRIVADQPLPHGTYRVDWRAVGAGEKPVTGTVGFSVR